MKQGAIFDMDGLLLDTERVWQETWQEAAERRGVKLEDDFRYAISGTSGEKAARVCARYYHVEKAEGDAIYHEVLERGREKFSRFVPVKPGAQRILAWFQENGVRTAVASSSPMELIRSNLRLSDLDGYFNSFTSGVGVPHGKPAPDVFLLAAERLELSPGQCYVFEDSFNGIRAAHAAGCTPVMIPDLMQPDDEIRSLTSGIYPTLDDALAAIRAGKI